MKIYVFLAFVLCSYAADVKETTKEAEPATNKDKRQIQDELVPTHIQYRVARKQEPVAPVEELQEDDKPNSRSDSEEYRPGQVISVNARELLELQPERKAPLSSNQLLQQLYANPQPEHNQNIQQIYYLDQGGRQVALQPSHAVIARPDYTSNGGEASVGAALSVSDNGASSRDVYNQDLFALLGQSPVRQEELRQHSYSQPQPAQHVQPAQRAQPVQQASTVQSVAPQYQQVDRYISKPSKKSKVHNKAQSTPPQPSPAPQQYLIETTNVQQQQTQQQSQLQSPLYRPAPQSQRASQALRYVSIPQAQQVSQQVLYEHPESQGLKIVPAPKLQPQQPRAQPNYRLLAQYQPEAQPKQYRILEAPRQAMRSQEQRQPSQSVERSVTYLKRFPEYEKMRSVKIYDPIIAEGLPQNTQIIGDQQYYLRPVYRGNEQRPRYEMPMQIKPEQRVESSKPAQSTIYVSKNLVPRKLARPQPYREQSTKVDQPVQPHYDQVNIEQHGQTLEEQRARLPPPKNNKAYTPEEFAALVAAGYSVTPVPFSAANLHEAQSRSSMDSLSMYPKRFIRPMASRRHQYLPLRGDDAP
ncbi:unnamed protein product [Arctia plantaginis]|uniref:Uncharacterized protein n=1 Tax=Arctia plantaginis TaxID=874455 RepID=A0A8S1A103_ARCPL|nr:unnamed protein product [Arctia plantaginis]CAB3238473.1 unnamed protein product [Arctia plantaginis]